MAYIPRLKEEYKSRVIAALTEESFTPIRALVSGM